jgi:adenylosuccinate synthase
MNLDVLLGLQWGDEGKGKIVDFLAPKYQIVARFQGGPNAGHTLEFEGIKHVLHQIPSGIFHEGIQNIIGNGVVIDPVIFMKEIEALKPYGVPYRKNLFISKKAHLILPTHRLLDAASEAAKGKEKIGSTLRGIGPAYMDKTGRNGLRVGDILSSDFKQRYQKLVDKHKGLLEFYDYEYNLNESEPAFFEAVEQLKELQLTDTEYMLSDALAQGKRVLAEGAQGTLLDIEFGSYPYVTSSHTTTAGACIGLGVAPKAVNEVLGIFKAYCTRVGSGPFPTELNDHLGEAIRQAGHEFGSTTGRSRRCGWLDLPALRYACMLNGVTQLFMMKVDVLSGFDEIKVCTHYKLSDGTITQQMPYCLLQEPVEPVYETLPGWSENIASSTAYEDLPRNLRHYVNFIEEYLHLPVALVSIGPDRAQTILRKNVFSM